MLICTVSIAYPSTIITNLKPNVDSVKYLYKSGEFIDAFILARYIQENNNSLDDEFYYYQAMCFSKLGFSKEVIYNFDKIENRARKKDCAILLAGIANFKGDVDIYNIYRQFILRNEWDCQDRQILLTGAIMWGGAYINDIKLIIDRYGISALLDNKYSYENMLVLMKRNPEIPYKNIILDYINNNTAPTITCAELNPVEGEITVVSITNQGASIYDPKYGSAKLITNNDGPNFTIESNSILSYNISGDDYACSQNINGKYKMLIRLDQEWIYMVYDKNVNIYTLSNTSKNPNELEIVNINNSVYCVSSMNGSIINIISVETTPSASVNLGDNYIISFMEINNNIINIKIHNKNIRYKYGL